jgi:general secretion pathway protein K
MPRSARSETEDRRQGGIALIGVLWAMILLAAIAGGFLTSSRTERHLAFNFVGQIEARALADAGVYRAIAGLMSLDPAQRWTAGEAGRVVALGDGAATVFIADEAGKIDLNTAAPELLAGLFRAAGSSEAAAESLRDAVADWIDEDDLRRPAGAEDPDYAAAGSPYRTGRRRFAAVAELQQVLGVSAALYGRVAPVMTVHSQLAGIDLRAAPPLALAAIPGLGAADIAAIEEAREGEGATVPRLSELGRFAVRSPENTFAIRSVGRAASGTIYARDAVVRLTGNPIWPYTIKAWRQGEDAVKPTSE